MRWLLSLLLVVGIHGAASGEESLSGVFVRKDYPDYRIEFLPGGKCLDLGCGGATQRRYAVESGQCVITSGPAEEPNVDRYRIVDGHLVDGEGNHWVPRDEAHVFPWKDASPVTIVVSDDRTNEPLREFAYSYHILTDRGRYDPMLVRPTPVRSDSGTFTLQAPAACKIWINIDHPDLVRGAGNFVLTSNDRQRRIDVRVAKGTTVRGKVVDADSGKPVAGALVSPVRLGIPHSAPDRRSAVTTDSQGQFTLRGVDTLFGIHAEHRDYFGSDSGRINEKENAAEVRTDMMLKSGERVSGVVTTSDGKPLAGVSVRDFSGKRVFSGKDGSFVLLSPSEDWSALPSAGSTFTLEFQKRGHVFRRLSLESKNLAGVKVTMEPRPALTGQVLDPEGRPVTKCEVFAGMGRNPADFGCVSDKVDRPDGKFSLLIESERDYEKEGCVWIGVKAPGFAPWETCIDAWKGEKSLTVHLTPGVAVTGKVNLLKYAKGPVTVKLVPIARETARKSSVPPSYSADGISQMQQRCGIREATADPQGVFRLEHVAPGRYKLIVQGKSITRRSKRVIVPSKGDDLGQLVVEGVGTVIGQVFDADGTVARFTSGWVVAEGRSLEFTTDEEGRFRVENVPAGDVLVRIPRGTLSDIMASDSESGYVVPGKTATVRIPSLKE